MVNSNRKGYCSMRIIDNANNDKLVVYLDDHYDGSTIMLLLLQTIYIMTKTGAEPHDKI